MLVIAHAVASDPGLTHAANQDRWLALPEDGVYLVSDGMADELPAQIVIDEFPRLLKHHLRDLGDRTGPAAHDRIRAAVAELNEYVRARGRVDPDHHGMGATLLVALLRGQAALLVHVGDSRAYLWRQQRLEPVTRDHSLIQHLLDRGQLTPEAAVRFSGGGGPTRYIGMSGTPLPEMRKLQLLAGDRLLLCSDGLPNMLDDGKIAEVLARNRASTETCQQLIAAANAAGGNDNITALIIAIDGASVPSA